MVARRNPGPTHAVQTNSANIVPPFNLPVVGRLERSKSAPFQIQNSHVVKIQILQLQIQRKIRRANRKNGVGSGFYQKPANSNTCCNCVHVQKYGNVQVFKSIEGFYVQARNQLLQNDDKNLFSADVIGESDNGVAHARLVVDALFSETHGDRKGLGPLENYLQDPLEVVPVSAASSSAAVVAVADVFYSGAEVAHNGVEEEAGQTCDQLLTVLVF